MLLALMGSRWVSQSWQIHPTIPDSIRAGRTCGDKEKCRETLSLWHTDSLHFPITAHTLAPMESRWVDPFSVHSSKEKCRKILSLARCISLHFPYSHSCCWLSWGPDGSAMKWPTHPEFPDPIGTGSVSGVEVNAASGEGYFPAFLPTIRWGLEGWAVTWYFDSKRVALPEDDDSFSLQ